MACSADFGVRALKLSETFVSSMLDFNRASDAMSSMLYLDIVFLRYWRLAVSVCRLGFAPPGEARRRTSMSIPSRRQQLLVTCVVASALGLIACDSKPQ